MDKILFVALVINIGAFVFMAAKYFNFREAVDTFNKASKFYADALQECQLIVNTQSDIISNIGTGTQEHEERLEAIETSLLNIKIAQDSQQIALQNILATGK